MKNIISYITVFLFRIAFWFRYRLKVKGLEKLTPEALNKPGGVLFLPNHPAVFVDPTMVTLSVFPKYKIRPMVVEYMYYTPIVNAIMKSMDAIPVPNFATSGNVLKRKKAEQVVQLVIESLRKGDNFLIYPAGRTKSTGIEQIGGASAVPRIIKEVPEANVVLVRIKGLWGSSFSRAFTGRAPALFPTLWNGVKYVLKNLLFFTPRRQVTIEFEPLPANFPREGTRLEMNKWLENWYNKPDGLTTQKGELPGDSFVLVSLSIWGEVYPEVKQRENVEENVDIDAISNAIKEKIIQRLAVMTDMDPEKIKPEMDLAADLGMDSLDIAELASFVQDEFDLEAVPVTEMTTVAKVMAVAAKQITIKEEKEEAKINLKKWQKKSPHVPASIPEGKTIPEVFLKRCEMLGNAPAVGDERSGVLTFSDVKMRVILLAEYIRTLPGEYVGILLPSSVGATLLIFAVQLAGKVPVMINWTVGPRHLETVAKLSNVQVVLSSWSFIDRVENLDLNGLEDRVVMLEDLRHKFTLGTKLKALWRSKKSVQSILKIFGTDKLTEEDKAVLLFTSGTESMPKGVPLTHKNVLTNQRAIVEAIDLYEDDILYGFLPPFHSFGFTVGSLVAFVAGLRTAYFPDPTDGANLAKGVEKWKITILPGAPTFLKSILKAAKPGQLQSVRLFATGAEKAPPELFKLVDDIGKHNTLVEGYGITECSPVLTFNRPGTPNVGVGQAASGVELLIVHPDTFEVLPTGARGLILAHGDNVFKGYLNPGLSSPFITIQGKEWYKTGDLGYLDELGHLIISGRQKRFIKVGPEMISLAAIEDALLHDALKRGKIASQEGPSVAICAKEVHGEKPKIYLFSIMTTSTEEVNRTLREAGFTNLVKVSSVYFLPELPVMGTGKINYRQLESQFLNSTAEAK